MDILKSYTVAELKKEIGKRRIKGYSKLKKADLHALIMKNKEVFHDLPKKAAAAKKTVTVKPKASKPTNKPLGNLPLRAATIIKQASALRKEDTEKRKIKVKDTNYFVSKIRELLRRKLGNQAYLNGVAFKTFIEVLIRDSVENHSGPRSIFNSSQVVSKGGFGSLALEIAKKLASKKYGLLEWTPNLSDTRVKWNIVKKGGEHLPLIELILTKNLAEWFPFSWKNWNVKKPKATFYGEGKKRYVTDGPALPPDQIVIKYYKIVGDDGSGFYKTEVLPSPANSIPGIILKNWGKKKVSDWMGKTVAQKKKYFNDILFDKSVPFRMYFNLSDMLGAFRGMYKDGDNILI